MMFEVLGQSPVKPLHFKCAECTIAEILRAEVRVDDKLDTGGRV